jgi:hypothetical protein
LEHIRMKLGEFGIGLVVTCLMFFVGAGLAARFVPVGLALLLGVATWFAAGYLLMRTMKSRPEPQRH